MNGAKTRMYSRRDAVATLAAGAAGIAALGAGARLVGAGGSDGGAARRALGQDGTPTTAAPTGPYTLPPLPYDVAALEPHIDTLTMRIHHDRHHQTYVDNLNKAVADLPDLAALDPVTLIQRLDRVPEEKRAAVRNNGGGHANHALFWEIIGPGGGGEPTGAVGDAIAAAFGGFAALREAVEAAGLARFGSGWAWLIVGADGKLAVTSTTNQDNPLMAGVADVPGTPVLGVDVWEHAYYLKYQNKRKDYLAAWWNTVNWDAVNERFAAAQGG